MKLVITVSRSFPLPSEVFLHLQRDAKIWVCTSTPEKTVINKMHPQTVTVILPTKLVIRIKSSDLSSQRQNHKTAQECFFVTKRRFANACALCGCLSLLLFKYVPTLNVLLNVFLLVLFHTLALFLCVILLYFCLDCVLSFDRILWLFST